jgi:hypothetical protein
MSSFQISQIVLLLFFGLNGSINLIDKTLSSMNLTDKKLSDNAPNDSGGEEADPGSGSKARGGVGRHGQPGGLRLDVFLHVNVQNVCLRSVAPGKLTKVWHSHILSVKSNV